MGSRLLASPQTPAALALILRECMLLLLLLYDEVLADILVPLLVPTGTDCMLTHLQY